MSPLLALICTVNFFLRAIGDVQVSDGQEVEYASRSLFPELMQSAGEGAPSLNLWLGDQTNTDLRFAPVIHQMMSQLPDPNYTVVGNHDRDLTGGAPDSTYRATFGQPYYSFDQGNVHFVVLNNVAQQGRKGYTGRIVDEQLAWLKQDLQRVSRRRQLVVAMHIPAAFTSNADSLYRIVEARGWRHLLVLSGHLHQVARQVTERPSGLTVHEVSVGASCGFWWVGERDAEGIPAALMQCGTPRGYFVFQFRRHDYLFHYKGADRDATRQMSLWVAGTDTLDAHIDTLAKRPVGEVYATVYGACDQTTVRCRLDDGTWVEGEHVQVMDANVARLQQLNSEGVYPTRHSRRNPARRMASRQVWRFRFAPGQLRGVHSLHVEASDRWGFSAKGDKVFWLP